MAKRAGLKSQLKKQLEVFIKEMEREIHYEYSSKSMERDKQRYTITLGKVTDMFLETYNRVATSDTREGRWADPTALNNIGVFEDAARAAMKSYLANIKKSSKDVTINYVSDEVIQFTSAEEYRDFTLAAKKAGLRVISKGLEAADKQPMVFYSDVMKETEGDRAQAKSRAEDSLFTVNMHREHSDLTAKEVEALPKGARKGMSKKDDAATTGRGMMAGRIQGLEAMLPGMSDKFFETVKESDNAADFFGPIQQLFKVHPNDFNMIDIRTADKIVDRAVVSWTANPSGKTRGDVGSGGKHTEAFQKIAFAAFKTIIDDKSTEELEQLVDLYHMGIGIGNALTDHMVAGLLKNQGHSGTAISVAKKKEIQRVRKRKATEAKGLIKSKPPKTSGKTRKVRPVSIADKQEARKQDYSRTTSLKNVLQKYLQETVIKNMAHGGPPRIGGPLVYRTGRFAQSIMVPHVMIKKDGTPSVMFRYMEYPYRVFETHPGRNPRKLIEKSVREVLLKQAKLSKQVVAGTTTRRNVKMKYISKVDFAGGERS